MADAREIALKALVSFRREASWSEYKLDSLIKAENADSRDAALALRLCYGVVQNMTLCDFYISHFSNNAKLQPIVRDILRLGVYQLLFMDRIPARAAVSEAVKSARSHANPKAASFVNAVLRAVADKANDLPQPPGSGHDYLSVKYSHPLWLVDKFAECVGEQELEALLAADNGYPPVYAQTNYIKAAPYMIAESMGEKAKPHEWLEGCFEITGSGNMGELQPFKDGWFMIQDPAAKLAVISADPKPGMFVLDVCAAPGGKAFALAIAMQNKGRILACDIHQNKLWRIEEEAKRLGISIIETAEMDAKLFNPELEKKADIVIADVPCSGFGTIRKKPDIRFKNQEETKNLPKIQLEILKNVSNYVKPGGLLVYSTCTIIKEENDGIVDEFLKENRAFSMEAFNISIGRNNGKFTFLPHIHGTDGFFVCHLRRHE